VSRPSPGTVPNPPGLRNAAFLCIGMGAFMGVTSTMEVVALADLRPMRQGVEERALKMKAEAAPLLAQDDDGRLSVLFDPELHRIMGATHVDRLEAMRGSRSVVLVMLSVLCSVIFVSAGRLLRAQGLPREGMRRTLAGALIGAAVVRTLDGAQLASINQRAAMAVKPLLETSAWGPQGLETAVVALVGLWTAVLVGAMLLLSQYLRSERVRQVVALQDRQLPQ
jgi:hypothetical protein